VSRRSAHHAGKGRATGSAAALCLLALGAGIRQGGAHDIKLPKETAVLRPSSLFGYRIAREKCGICHSADYINLQPPRMTLAQWTAEMVKMQHAYGAPLDEAEIKLLAIYLTSAYGDAATLPPDAAQTSQAPLTPSAR
jgi:hypothetical protein